MKPLIHNPMGNIHLRKQTNEKRNKIFQLNNYKDSLQDYIVLYIYIY